MPTRTRRHPRPHDLRLTHEALERRTVFAVEAYQVSVLSGMTRYETNGTAFETQPFQAPTAPVIAADPVSAILASVTGTVTIPAYMSAGVYPFPGGRFTVKSGSDFGFGSPESPVWAIGFEDWFDYDYNDWCWIVEATPIDSGKDDCPTTCDTGVQPATGIPQVQAGVGAGQSLTYTFSSTPGGAPAAAPAATSSTASSSPFGNGWSAAGLPTLESIPQPPDAAEMMVVMFGTADQRVWQASGDSGSFTRARGLATADSFSVSGGQYRYRTASGTVFTFNGFDESIPEVNRGRVVAQADPSGNQTVYSFNADGSIARVTSLLAGQTTPVEIQDYVSLPATDPNAGKVGRIDVRRGDSTLVRSVSYAYYDGTSAFGTLGDLAGITVRDAAGTLLDAQAYRYTAGSQVLATFDTDAVRRATAAGIDLATATNTSVAPFATNVYGYDAQGRVVRRDVQGAGCSSCTGGIGTFTYAYATNPLAPAGSLDAWATKTTETRPDGTQRIVYSNARTQPMLEVIRTTEGGVTKQHQKDRHNPCNP